MTSIDPNSPLPRYYQIYNALLSQIELGELQIGDSLPPERQIADNFGVARPTVVKALDLLEQEGRIKKQQGRGNIVLGKKQAKSGNTIAFVSSPNFAEDLLMGISQKAFENSCHLQILGIDADFEHLENYLNTCLDNGVQGFIVYGRPKQNDAIIYKKLLDKNIPIVMIDRYYPTLNCDTITYENESAAYELTNHLLNRGHQTIAIIPGQEINTTSVRDRLNGCKKALENAGISYTEDLIWPDIYESYFPGWQIQNNYTEKLAAKLELYKPTAIITINELLANYLMHDLMHIQDSFMKSALDGILDSSSYHINIELASFGPKSISNFNYLKVYAMHPTFELGSAATSLLIDRINKPTSDIKHLTMPMELVECSDQSNSMSKVGGAIQRN